MEQNTALGAKACGKKPKGHPKKKKKGAELIMVHGLWIECFYEIDQIDEAIVKVE